MTEEEFNRFALVLRECDRICAMIAEDEAAAGPHGGDELPADPPLLRNHAESAVLAAA